MKIQRELIPTALDIGLKHYQSGSELKSIQRSKSLLLQTALQGVGKGG